MRTFHATASFDPSDIPSTKSEFPLREHLIEGKFFLAAGVCGALAKVAAKMPKDPRGYRVCAKTLMIVTSCLRLADSAREGVDVGAAATADDRRRLHQCITMVLKVRGKF